MLKPRLILLVVTVLLCGTLSFASTIPPVGPADPMYAFTFSLGGNTGSALLDTTSLGGGRFWVTGGTLYVTGGADVGTYPLIAGGPTAFTSPSGAFIVDNVLQPSSDPILDGNGLLFGNGSLEINIWGNTPGNYSFYSYNGSYNVQFTGAGTATATLVPEPASLMLLGSGLLGIAGFTRKFMGRP